MADMAEGWLFLQSILLGAGAAVVYDFLRPFRLRFRRCAPFLDGAYPLAVGAAAFAFLLRRAEGELRGFLVVGAIGGAVLYAAGMSELLRPLWDFWAETAVELVRLGLLPVKAAAAFAKKMVRRGKNLFYFARKCYTIRKIGYQAQFSKGGGRRGKRDQTGKKDRKRPCDQAHHPGPHRPHRLAALRPAGPARRRPGGAGPLRDGSGGPPPDQ
ncbi:MAG: spore cortex biosynthesis protein YabQ [Oscillibacter sp.]|nr:spore cortex biosynthesis protein YabQ [Oscillibacter sp.]